MTRKSPIVLMIVLGAIVSLQVMILRGDFGEGMRQGSELFWGINRCGPNRH